MNIGSTGNVITIEDIPEGHQVGILWVGAPSTPAIGFGYDEDETRREMVVAEVATFAEEHRLKPFGDYGFADNLVKARYDTFIEEIDQEEFLDRFGGYPRRRMTIFDEGGHVGDNRRAYGIAAESPMPEHDQTRREMTLAAHKAAAISALIIAAVVAAFFAACFALSAVGGYSVAQTAPMMLLIVLAALGIGSLIGMMPKLSNRVYKKIYR